MTTVEIKKIKPVFEDERGEIFDILEAPVEHIGMITSKTGAQRAKHYHKKSTQYTYVLEGKIELKIKDLREDGKEIETYVMEPGDFVEIPPMIIHMYTAITDSTFLDFTTESRLDTGYEDDTIRVDSL